MNKKETIYKLTIWANHDGELTVARERPQVVGVSLIELRGLYEELKEIYQVCKKGYFTTGDAKFITLPLDEKFLPLMRLTKEVEHTLFTWARYCTMSSHIGEYYI